MRYSTPLGAGTFRVTNAFGARPDLYAAYGLAGHPGVDLLPKVGPALGAEVMASHDGLAEVSGDATNGNYVRVRTTWGYSLYAHLSEVAVASGETISAGQVIGKIGFTGRCIPAGPAGAHLHWAVWIEGARTPGLLSWVDPLTWIEERRKEAMPKTPLSWLFQRSPSPEMVALVERSGAEHVGIIEAGAGNPFARAKTHVRLWNGGDNTDQGYINQGRQGAAALYEQQARRLDAMRWAHTFQPLSGPDVNGWEALGYYDDFFLELARLYHRDGRRITGGLWYEGNPGGSQEERITKLGRIGPAICSCDYWGQQGYWRPPEVGPTDPYHVLRPLDNALILKRLGYRPPPIVFIEYGIDGMVDVPGKAKVKSGWKTHVASRAEYWQQILRFEGAVSSKIVAAFRFVEAPEPEWAGYAAGLELMKIEGDFIAAATPEIPVHQGLPDDEVATEPAALAEKARWWLEEEQREREKGHEERAGRIRLSLIRLHYRLENALKSAG